MVNIKEILQLFINAFTHCVAWTNSLLSAVDGVGLVISGLLIVLVVSLIIIPLRGARLSDGFRAKNFADMVRNTTHKPK